MDWSERIGRRIKLRDLHILQAVAQQGSMAKAARHLAISQPVISKVIADLEREVGWPLLDRDRHGAEPTVYGASLLKHGLAVFDELRQSVKEIEYLADPSTGELRIASTDVMAAGFLPAVITSLHRRHPHLGIHVKQEQVVAKLYRELRERDVDFIIGRILMPFAEEDLSADVLFNESTVIVAGTQNRWTRRRKVELADLVHEPWILPTPGSPGWAIMSKLFQSCGLEIPRRGAVSASIQMHNALVGKGPYLSTLPGSMVRLGGCHPSIKVLPVKLPTLPSPAGIITLRRRTMNPAAQLFIEHAREVAKPLAETSNARKR